jgi:hypothetical protein
VLKLYDTSDVDDSEVVHVTLADFVPRSVTSMPLIVGAEVSLPGDDDDPFDERDVGLGLGDGRLEGGVGDVPPPGGVGGCVWLFIVYEVPFLVVRILWLVLALTTLLVAVTEIGAVPATVALNVMVAISWLPVTAGKAPRSRSTVPPPPELDAAMLKAEELL